MKVLLFAAVLSLAAAARAQEARPAQTPEPPQVPVEEQQGSPLRILSVKTKWALPDRSGVELYVTVEGAADRPISAYATRDAAGDEKSGRHCLLLHAQSPGKVLRRGQSEGRSTWTRPDLAARMRWAVDFVEFTDGSTWGEDLCGSAEVLAASRAGAREARRLLREVFAAGGADAVVRVLRPGRFKVSPPEGLEAEWQRMEAAKEGQPPDDAPWAHTFAWWRGYAGGFESYMGRIRHANEEWGFAEIEHALGRPIDALEEKER